MVSRPEVMHDFQTGRDKPVPYGPPANCTWIPETSIPGPITRRGPSAFRTTLYPCAPSRS